MTEKKEPVKKVSPRRRARECAVQALYSWAISGNAPEQVELTFVVDQDLKGVDKPYFSRLFRQTVANVEAVDFSMSHYLDRALDELDPIEKAILRELIAVGNRIAENSYSPKGKDIKMVLDEAEREVFAIAEKRSSSTEGPQNVISVLESTIARIDTLSKLENHSGVTGVTTGFVDLDKKTAGLQPSDLIIVAARPSMGKTTFAMNLCENAAMASDKPVLVFSLEMPAEQIMMRMIASLARVDQTKIRTGQNLDETEWSKIASVFGMFKQKNNLYIDDSSGLTPTELRSRARRVYRENNGLSMIMVDYLQLMRAPAFSDNRTLEIAEISRSLKALAKELEVPVVALSQLNRTLEQRADKRPVNSDLRESGSIEQDADLIMFIYRDEVYNDNSEDKGVAEIIIGKQRNGPIGRVRLAFNGQFSRFDNLAEQREYRDDY